jgi:hypothetical protein
MQQMNLQVLPTLNTSIEHEIEPHHASPVDVHAPTINDQ